MASIHKFPTPAPAREFAKPPVVSVRHPLNDDASLELTVSENLIEKLIQGNLRTRLLQMWVHVIGELPPIPNAFKMPIETNGRLPVHLAEVSAIYQGIKRPCGFEDDGKDILIYIIESPLTIRWKPSLACMATFAASPRDTVTAVYVRPDAPLQEGDGCVRGRVINWEFVEACREHTNRPKNSDERYDHLLWSR